MSISSEIARIQTKRDQSFTAVANKGVTVPASSTIDDLPGLIDLIEQGGSLQEKTVSPSESSIEVVPDDGQVLVVSTGPVIGTSRTFVITKSVDLSDLIAGTTYHVVGSGYVTNYYTGVVDNWEVDTDVVFNSTTTTLEFTHSGSFLSQLSVGSSSIQILVQTSGDNYANSNLSFYAYSGTAYDGLSKVTVNAIPSTYVGSGITRRSASDLTASGATVSVPAGYYESSASKAVANGMAGTPSATKGTVSNHSVSVTPSVTNTAGYISGGTVSGTAVSVSASELVSGSKSVSISSNGTTSEDVTNYASASITVNVPNTYTSGDEGKVVSDGALVSQTSDTVTQNGTVDTTLINSLTVNVSGGSGGIVYQDAEGYIHLSEDAANVISIVDELDIAGGTIRTITGAVGGGSSGYSLDDICERQFTETSITLTATSIYPFTFANCTSLQSVNAPYVTKFGDATATSSVGSYIFYNCTNLTSVNLPSLTQVGTGGYQFHKCTSLPSINLPNSITGQHMFDNCSSLVTAVIGVAMSTPERLNGYAFAYCSSLTTVDIKTTQIYTQEFRDARNLTTIILRSDSLISLYNVNAFTNTRFVSGGAGGTIYIPKALYDHLGDGTASDYKAATNWSTYDGYGTITWAKIEGSQYENYYADGTAIPTT